MVSLSIRVIGHKGEIVSIFDTRLEWWYGLAQCAVYALVIVAIGFVLSKIELPDRGDSHNKGKGKK